MGPAYAYGCLLVRMNPVRAWSETDVKHPPDGHRAELILQTLDRMDREADSKGRFTGPVQKLRSLWGSALGAAGVGPEPPAAVKTEIGGLADEIYSQILNPVVPHLRYNTLPRAFKQQTLLSDLNEPLPDDLALTDLLNAAWRERLTKGVDACTVNGLFLAVCQRAGIIETE